MTTTLHLTRTRNRQMLLYGMKFARVNHLARKHFCLVGLAANDWGAPHAKNFLQEALNIASFPPEISSLHNSGAQLQKQFEPQPALCRGLGAG